MATRKRRSLAPEVFSSVEDQDLEQELQPEQEETYSFVEQELPPDESGSEEKITEAEPLEPVVLEKPLAPVANRLSAGRQNRPSLYPKKVEIASKKRNTPRFS